MKRYFLTALSLLLLACAVGLTACSDDESFDAPTLELSDTNVTASSGDEVTVDISTTTDGGFKNLVVTKLWDGVAEDTETFTTAITSYTYTVIDEDADHVVTLNFKLTDNKNKTVEKELVIAIDLTPLQILLKYNWRLAEEIRELTGEDDISDVYNDDVYRFNADGTYDKSIGAKADDFGDLITNYCFYNFNGTTMRLLMSKSENFFGTDAVDTLDITIIDEAKFYADVTYYGLDAFNTGTEEVPYEEVENYQKRFVAVAKTSSFDPYGAGSADNAGPGVCRNVELEND